VGEGRSEVDGGFVISLPEGPDAGRILSQLANDPQAAVILQVDRDDDLPYLITPPLTLSQGTLVVELEVVLEPLEPCPIMSMWADLADRLSRAHIDQLNEIVRMLAAGLIFNDWDLQRRHGIIDALEAAFLDPTGLLRAAGPLPGWVRLKEVDGLISYCECLGNQDVSVRAAYVDLAGKIVTFDDLLAVDWVIDPVEFADGDINGVMRRAQERYRVKPVPHPLIQEEG
jgi:hypothetical protein